MDRFLFEESMAKKVHSTPIPTEIYSSFFSANPKSVILGISHELARIYMENVKNDSRMIDHDNPGHDKAITQVNNLELCRVNYILKNGSIVYLQFSYRSGNQKLHGRKYFCANQRDAIDQVKKKSKKDKLLKASYIIYDQYYEIGNLRLEPGEKFVSASAEVIDDIRCVTLETTQGEKLHIGELSINSPDESLSDWNPAPRKTINKVIPKNGLSFMSAGFNGRLIFIQNKEIFHFLESIYMILKYIQSSTSHILK